MTSEIYNIGFIFGGVVIAECSFQIAVRCDLSSLIISIVILVFRTWAIWDRDRTIGLGLTLFVVALGLPAGYLTYKGLTSIKCEYFSYESQQL